MNKKILYFVLLLTTFMLMTGCGKKKEEEVSIKNYRIEDLSFRLPSTLKKQKINDKSMNIFIYEDTTLTILVDKDIEVSVEEYANQNEKWSIHSDSLDEIIINDVLWYKDSSNEITWITKNENDIYCVKISSLNDNVDLVTDIVEILETAMIFR